MGGKTKLLDPKILEVLYTESREYEKQTYNSLQIIRNELGKLRDPSFQQGLPEEKASQTKAAISNVSDAFEYLKEQLETMSRVIDVKLAGAAQYAQEDNQLNHSASVKTKEFNVNANFNLKK